MTPSRKPRMCGEKQLLIARHFDDARITPACAGKRGKGNEQSNGNGDHPRMCGEKGLPTLRYSPQSGSPPHVRGKGGIQQRLFAVVGITPACAGKRLLPPSDDTREWDHPRICGEKSASLFWFVLFWGSPPHMRGKEDERGHENVEVRITPACAGKSTSTPSSTTRGRDHPRMCGEKKIMACYKPLIRGSPPHVRGKVRG